STGEFVKLRGADFFLHGGELRFRGAGDQDISSMPCQASENFGDLLGSFPLAEDNLGHPGAQRAMMVHLGESQIFEWKMTQALDGVVRRELPLLYLIEQFADGIRVHGPGVSIQQSAF